MSLRVGVYPGSFDPPTLGHLDVIARGAKLVDRLVVGVGINPGKVPLFAAEERIALISELAADLKAADPAIAAIEVVTFSGLAIDFARAQGATVLLRGLRSVTDFEYEFQMTGMNATMAPEVETVFLLADVRHLAIASSLVKDVARLGGDFSAFVPPKVHDRIIRKLAQIGGGR